MFPTVPRMQRRTVTRKLNVQQLPVTEVKVCPDILGSAFLGVVIAEYKIRHSGRASGAFLTVLART